MLIKQIINSPADIIPDYQTMTMTIRLHSLSANRFNKAAEYLAQLITDTETIYPGTDLRIVFKTTAPEFARGQESCKSILPNCMQATITATGLHWELQPPPNFTPTRGKWFIILVIP